MDKLKTTARRLQYAVLAILLITPAAIALTATFGGWAQVMELPHEVPLNETRITGMAMLAVLAVSAIKPAAYLMALWFLYRLLELYGLGIVFAADNVAAIRRIGWALVAVDVAGTIQSLVRGPVLTFFEITEAHITLQIELTSAMIGLFIVLVAHVMDIGRELKEQDNLVI